MILIFGMAWGLWVVLGQFGGQYAGVARGAVLVFCGLYSMYDVLEHAK